MKLNWQQSVVIFSLVVGGVPLVVLSTTTGGSFEVYAWIFGVIAFFVALTAGAIYSRLRHVSSRNPERQSEEKRRILNQIGWGYARVTILVVVTIVLSRVFVFEFWNETYILIPGYGAALFAFAPILDALSTDAN